MKRMVLAASFLAFGNHCLADDPYVQVRADFVHGRAVVLACAPVRADAAAFIECTNGGIWRPYGRLLNAVPGAILMGEYYQELMMRVGIDTIPMNSLDDSVRENFKGDYGTFCRLFLVDCSQLQARRSEVGKGQKGWNFLPIQ